MHSWDLHLEVRDVEPSGGDGRRADGGCETSSCRGWGENSWSLVLVKMLSILFTQEAVFKEECEIRKQGWKTFKADFKSFKLAISPQLEALLFSGERLASITDSLCLPSHLSLQLVNLSSQVISGDFLVIILVFTFYPFLLSVVANSNLLCSCNQWPSDHESRQKRSSTKGDYRKWRWPHMQRGDGWRVSFALHIPCSAQ